MEEGERWIVKAIVRRAGEGLPEMKKCVSYLVAGIEICTFRCEHEGEEGKCIFKCGG